MMEKRAIRKNLLLSLVGAGLQAMGSVCLLVAAIGIGKEINTQIKKTIIHELSKQISEN